MRVIKSVYLFIKHLLLSVFKSKNRSFSDEERQRLEDSFKRIRAIECEMFSDESKFEERGKKFLECPEGTFELPDDFSIKDFLELHGIDYPEQALENH